MRFVRYTTNTYADVPQTCRPLRMTCMSDSPWAREGEKHRISASLTYAMLTWILPNLHLKSHELKNPDPRRWNRCHPCSFSTINIPSDDAKIVNLYTSQFPVLVQVILQEHGREVCSVNRPAIRTPWEPLDVYEMMFEVSCKSTLITSVRTPDDVDEDNIVTSTEPYCKLT